MNLVIYQNFMSRQKEYIKAKIKQSTKICVKTVWIVLKPLINSLKTLTIAKAISFNATNKIYGLSIM